MTAPETPHQSFLAREIKTAALCPTCASSGRVCVDPDPSPMFTTSGGFGDVLRRDAERLRGAHAPCPTCRPVAFLNRKRGAGATPQALKHAAE